MRKEKKPETMKMLIKKIAVVACAATLAFSMIPATVQAAGWKQNKNGYLWQENDYSYPKSNGPASFSYYSFSFFLFDPIYIIA